MNIWILNHYAIPPDTPGGTRHFDFGTELVKRGHQVSIFAAGFSHRTRKEERLERKQNYLKQNIDGVNFIWIRTPPYYGGNDWRRVRNMLSYTLRVTFWGLKIKEKPDVILASSPHPFAGLAGYVLAKIKRAQFILEIRDLWPETFVQIGGYSNKSPVVILLRMLEKLLYRRARKIVALHPEASNYISGLGIPSENIVHIPNGINPELFDDNSVELPEELVELVSRLRFEGKTVVGYTGAHGIVNALDTIVEAANVLQHNGATKIHFLLVGDGPEKERLIRKAHEMGLGNVSFFKSIPKNTIPKLLRVIDITIVSWRRSDLYKYGMSTNKLWDYMMCARPIVWAIESANDPVAEANCGITVPPEEPDKLANAILELYNLSEKERQEMGMRGYEYVMKYHSTPVLANKLLEAIGDVRPR